MQIRVSPRPVQKNVAVATGRKEESEHFKLLHFGQMNHAIILLVTRQQQSKLLALAMATVKFLSEVRALIKILQDPTPTCIVYAGQ